jgi:Flp pilus assembly protein TadG
MRRLHYRKPGGQSTVEFALLSSALFLLLMGIFDFGRAISAYISIAEAAHEGARMLVLRSNKAASQDSSVVDATKAMIGGGGIVLVVDPCIAAHTIPCPSTSPPVNTGYVWLTQNRTWGNQMMTVKITYSWTPMTALIQSVVGNGITLTASSSMRAEY